MIINVRCRKHYQNSSFSIQSSNFEGALFRAFAQLIENPFFFGKNRSEVNENDFESMAVYLHETAKGLARTHPSSPRVVSIYIGLHEGQDTQAFKKRYLYGD